MYAVCVHVFKWNENQNDSIFPAHVILTIADTVTKNNDDNNNSQTISKGLWACFGDKKCGEDLHDGILLCNRLGQEKRSP